MIKVRKLPLPLSYVKSDLKIKIKNHFRLFLFYNNIDSVEENVVYLKIKISHSFKV